MTQKEYTTKDLEAIAEKADSYTQGKTGVTVPLTPRRMMALRWMLGTTQKLIDIDYMAGKASDRGLRDEDLVWVGEMDFLLNHFFSDGDIPNDFTSYAEFVARIKETAGAAYDRLIDAKLQRDARRLAAVKKGGEPASLARLHEGEDPAYARSLVNIVEAEALKADQGQITIMVGGESLYAENLPEDKVVFPDLPRTVQVILTYTGQGLELDLESTLKGVKAADKRRVEKILVESLTTSFATKEYVTHLFEGIQSALQSEEQ